jgi:fructoselysine and glucoselysine-specific PTS system IIA component
MKIILASHGGLAKGMKSTLNMIVGDQASIEAYSAYDEENIDFVSNIKKTIENKGAEQIVIVTDVMGGSVNTAMTELVLKNPEVLLITGMNLPLVLSLATCIDNIDSSTVDRLVEEGQKGIIDVNKMINLAKEDEQI